MRELLEASKTPPLGCSICKLGNQPNTNYHLMEDGVAMCQSCYDEAKNERQGMKVALESPYAGDVERNLQYARQCMKDSLNRGEYPIASHLLYTQMLDDTIPAERKQGINAGLEWALQAEKAVFYVDLGWSNGMKAARLFYNVNNIEVEERAL